MRAAVDKWVLVYGSHDGRDPIWVLMEDGATRGAFPRADASVLIPKLAPVVGQTAAMKLTKEAKRQMGKRSES